MKKLLSIAFLILSLFSINSHSQSDTIAPPLPKTLGSCEDGIQKAISDAEKGIYKLLSYGMPIIDDWDYQEYYETYVQAKYGIIIGNGGCVVYEETRCYTQKMDKIISKKFGDDIFEKADKEARIKYDSLTQTRAKSDYIFNHVDVYPSFKGGNDSLHTFLKTNLEYNGTATGKVLASLVIEKDGSIGNIVIRKGLCEEADNEVQRVMSIMPDWNPGKHMGQNVRVEIVLPINFSAE